ncbi:MAG: uracil-DNA glycosylase [Betaproteobacteria bacterium]|jgi:uracil-DNA glycosylase|nr:uracil-DNA glycosylase [Pseudomonadota bacterium]NBO02738.1 uracil-DNA glycosylase [Betaproteobacteria bacterium]NDG04542.1 uracil-DNA glycosylase [Alphaproteobacteria bacterium]HAB48497.1 hypothetical protein [Lautropia sp.]NBO95384.1 uracil-DNA glycosylase [Betaproteobacteria bacterium]
MIWSDAQIRAWQALELGPRWQLKVTLQAKQAEVSVVKHWEQLRASVASCQSCALARSRQQTVFGSGTVTGQWALIGEAPGAEEDLQGEAFVGMAGQLLDQMLSAMGWNRHKDLFIANVLKCRPPGNRNPSPEEISACAGHLSAQLQLLRPKAMLVMGRIAAQHLLGQDVSIASLRGKPQSVRIGSGAEAFEVPTLVTYHPAYLLRNLEDKAKAWEDLNSFADLLGRT